MRASASILRLRRAAFLKAAARTARALRERRRADERYELQRQQAHALDREQTRLAEAAATAATGHGLHACTLHGWLLEDRSRRLDQQRERARQDKARARDSGRDACRALALETARWRVAAELDHARCRGERQRREQRIEEEAPAPGVVTRGVRNPDTVSGKTGHPAGPRSGVL